MKCAKSVLVVLGFALLSPAPFSHLIPALLPTAHAQNQTWITQFGTSSNDIAWALAPDGAGGVLVTGWTEGSLGGPFAGGLRYGDAWLARYDGTGNQRWIVQFGTKDDELASAIASDGAGGAIVAGETWGSLGGPNAGAQDAYLARFDSAGNQLWIRQFGTSEFDGALALVPDGAGGVMVAGYTSGSLGGPNAGSTDLFLARYNSAGDRLWIRQFGTSLGDSAHALAPDGAGGVMVAGSTDAGVHGGYPNVFLARYNGAGDQLWFRPFGTGDADWIYALTPDCEGGVFVAGYTDGSLGGPNAGFSDVFLARYDSDGNQLWVTQFGTSNSDTAFALVSDGACGMMVAGRTGGSLGGSSAGGLDAFLARYDSAGNRLWIRQFGTNIGSSRGDIAAALAPDAAGGVIVAGSTPGSLGGPNAGAEDAYLARYEIDSCYADCDTTTGIGVLDLFDFLCFQNSFVNAEPYACDCDTSTGSGVCDVFDFLCFQNAFVGGCP